MAPEKHRGKDAAPIDNDHQKSVQGKNQRGPEEKIDRDAGGNLQSKGQNIDPRRSGTGTGKQASDVGDERGPHGGSGGGQGNRQNRAVKRG